MGKKSDGPSVPFSLRIPSDLLSRIRGSAAKTGKSLGGEIVAQLEMHAGCSKKIADNQELAIRYGYALKKAEERIQQQDKNFAEIWTVREKSFREETAGIAERFSELQTTLTDDLLKKVMTNVSKMVGSNRRDHESEMASALEKMSKEGSEREGRLQRRLSHNGSELDHLRREVDKLSAQNQERSESDEKGGKSGGKA